ncbi:MAG: nitroreductase [Deltaproteobacteria bacterium]|nr:nitroreductase [Deltaproteobacteria bacterium]
MTSLAAALETTAIALIRRRYSCRVYENTPIDHSAQAQLSDFFTSHPTGPLGTRVRFSLVAATDDDRESLKGLGTYGMIKNAAGFLIGAADVGARNLEDLGYRLEQAVLLATELGLGTCWLGGTFSKSGFARRIDLAAHEAMPAVVAVGNAAEGNRARDWVRRSAGSDQRLPWERLFFDESFANPMTGEQSRNYAEPLEMVRLGPSASNKQPWRVVHRQGVWHFYLQRTKGYGKGSLAFKLLRLADLQRVDMGIALCHFELAARELGLTEHWVVEEPDIRKPDQCTEYTVSWKP